MEFLDFVGYSMRTEILHNLANLYRNVWESYHPILGIYRFEGISQGERVRMLDRVINQRVQTCYSG